MKEAVPRIFRSLETPGGQAGFDTIVAAAVAAYGSLRAPTERQARDFGRLVIPLWERTSDEARRALAAALSHAPRVPREIVERLVEAPVEIAAPFLVSTPALTTHDIARLKVRSDERIARILQGRAERGLPGASAERAPVEAPPLAPEDLGASTSERQSDPAELVRATLKELALRGRRASPSAQETPAQALLRAARGGQGAFFEILGAQLGLSPTERAAIAADESGHALAGILKGLSIGTGDALSILMLVRPQVGFDIAAFEAMAAHYRSLASTPGETGQGASAPVHAPAARGLESRDAERSSFGRRKDKPSGARARSGG